MAPVAGILLACRYDVSAMMGVWEALAVLISVYEQQRWIVYALIGLIALLLVDRLCSAEWFDRIPALDVHVDPGNANSACSMVRH